jgi:hypothetical protein
MSLPDRATQSTATDGGGIASRDLLAVVGLVVGSLVIPVAGWLVGAVLLWRSDSWTVGEKLLGTLVWPGGLLLPLALPFLPYGVQLLRSPVLAMSVISVLVLTPMAVGALLLRRAAARHRH